MKWIINYFRECFCVHDWLVEEIYTRTYSTKGTKVYMRCKKCGYNKRHWKAF